MRTLLFFFLLLQVNLFAQSGVNSNTAAELPRLSLKLNAGVLLNPFKQALAFGTDLRLAPRITADFGAGFFFNSITFATIKGESYLGLRLRGGLKYYLNLQERHAYYLGIEGKFQDIRNLRNKALFRQGQQYLEFALLERKVRTQGLALRTGWQFFLGKKKRLLIEQYLGLGIDFNRVSLPIPADAELSAPERIFDFEFPPGKSRNASLLLGVHVGYLLW